MSEFTRETAADASKLIELSLIEDTGAAELSAGVDCTTDSLVPAESSASASFVSRDHGIVCGIEVARLVVESWAPRVTLECAKSDGDHLAPQETIATLSGPAHDILTIERTCLNFMCRLSGISTLTKQFVERVAETKAAVLDTRKTTPGWRRLEKYAVACGGGHNHRMGLYDAVMLKDNHLAFFRSQVDDGVHVIPEALQQSRNWIAQRVDSLPNGANTILQLEVDTLEQFEISIAQSNAATPDIVLLDNMNLEELSQAVAIRNERAAEVLLEASGGVNLNTIADIAATGVDRISVGALTHSAVNFDIGLDWISRNAGLA